MLLEKPLPKEMGPSPTGLAATIVTDTTRGSASAAAEVQISSNQHSSLVLVWVWGHTLVLANPHTSQDSRECSESDK